MCNIGANACCHKPHGHCASMWSVVLAVWGGDESLQLCLYSLATMRSQSVSCQVLPVVTKLHFNNAKRKLVPTALHGGSIWLTLDDKLH